MQDGPDMTKALLIRMDRIGDLVLTLPVDQALTETKIVDEIDWWIPKGLSFITDSASPKRRAREVAREISLLDFLKLVREIRSRRYTHAAVFQGPWWVGLALFLAGVPRRIGVLSKAPSFLFFNYGVRQKRSRSDRSELEYNFALLEEALKLRAGSLPRHTLKLRGAFPLVPKLTAGNYFVVHPGMGGSALNWPTARYIELVRTLARRATVVITGTKTDEEYLAPLKVNLEGEGNVLWLDGKLKGQELIGLLANAIAIVAPSTGVLHLAASTGRPTVGLFSLIRVQRAIRWGPQGLKTAFVEAPDEAPESMGKISAEDVVDKINSLI
jgi:heptosyltransferase I